MTSRQATPEPAFGPRSIRRPARMCVDHPGASRTQGSSRVVALPYRPTRIAPWFGTDPRGGDAVPRSTNMLRGGPLPRRCAGARSVSPTLGWGVVSRAAHARIAGDNNLGRHALACGRHGCCRTPLPSTRAFATPSSCARCKVARRACGMRRRLANSTEPRCSLGTTVVRQRSPNPPRDVFENVVALDKQSHETVIAAGAALARPALLLLVLRTQGLGIRALNTR